MDDVDRRSLLRRAALLGGGMAAGAALPAWAQPVSPGLAAARPLSGDDLRLTVQRGAWTVDRRAGRGVLVDGALPGPLLRLKEGQRLRIAVQNRMDEATSIHWHGLLVPFAMDGVPGVTFPGIAPHSTFVYEFPIQQSGTYWYHSHSGFQEQEGLYGPIVIDPQGGDPGDCDREHVIVLSDFAFIPPMRILQKLKQEGGVFNYRRQTVAGLISGKDQTLSERLEWARMLMDPTDIADVTGAVYTFLVNGHGPTDNWTGLFKPGERVKLRIINAASQTIFNVRIPGLKLKVVAADGQDVRPVPVDELQIANAETYDLIVEPQDRAYTFVAEASDRSGMGRATLAPRAGMTAPVPPLRARPIDRMKDMGMTMAGEPDAEPGMSAQPPRGSDRMAAMEGMDMSMRNPANAPQVRMGPGVEMIAPMPQDRTGQPGQGLESVGHRVLTYRDLVAVKPNPDPRPPSRQLQIHLTGNMERFVWGFDGMKYSDAPRPYAFQVGERVRVTLVNDTMMAHPIHLHGHFFDLITEGPEGFRPRKHTVSVAPGGKVSWDVTPVPGDWAFHCHMLYHMMAGMFQVFAVRPLEESGA